MFEQEMASGLFVDVSDPDPALLTLKDIAAHLAGIRRFNGHSPVSVAEHSVIVSLMMRDSGASLEVQFAAFMHDAHEAYLGDISRPVKRLLGPKIVNSIIGKFDEAICKRYGIALDDMQGAGVKHFDSLALRIEAHWHMCSAGEGAHWSRLPEPNFMQTQRYRPECWGYEKARMEFIGKFNEFARVFEHPFVL